MEPSFATQIVGIAALGPVDGASHGGKRLVVRGGPGQALVEHHHDVAAKGELDIDGALGRKEVSVAVQMRLEQDALFGNLAERFETEDLEAAGIGEDGAGPGHEAVESAPLTDALVPGTQKQVIGVGEDDLGVEVVNEVARGERLDGGLGADGHENRRFDDAVGGMEQAGARPCFGAGSLDFEVKRGVQLSIVANGLANEGRQGSGLKRLEKTEVRSCWRPVSCPLTSSSRRGNLVAAMLGYLLSSDFCLLSSNFCPTTSSADSQTKNFSGREAEISGAKRGIRRHGDPAPLFAQRPHALFDGVKDPDVWDSHAGVVEEPVLEVADGVVRRQDFDAD